MINILYEDSDIVVCEKESGLLSEYSENSPISLPKLLASQLNVKELFTVHRLDKDVGGVIVYAKNTQSASKLSSQMTDGSFKKQYVAVASGRLEEESGTLCDLLFHDIKKNKTYTAKKKRAGVKEAILNYNELLYDEENDLSVLNISLVTGRTHQIRVQLASRKCPILGDRKYGSSLNLKPIRLYSYSLSFSHPKSNEIVSVSSTPSWLSEYTKDIVL